LGVGKACKKAHHQENGYDCNNLLHNFLLQIGLLRISARNLFPDMTSSLHSAVVSNLLSFDIGLFICIGRTVVTLYSQAGRRLRSPSSLALPTAASLPRLRERYEYTML
jgi:hypothetical protein